MAVLFRREVPIRDIVAVQPNQARALQSPIRIAMLDLLAIRPMSVDELAEELPAHGFRKATNTLRHHLEVLQQAGLVELALLEQTRGAVLKFFAASARPLHHRLPEASQKDLDALAARLNLPVREALDRLATEDSERVERLAQSIRRCPRCPESHYLDYVLISALHQACVEYLRRPRGADPAPPPVQPPAGRKRSRARSR